MFLYFLFSFNCEFTIDLPDVRYDFVSGRQVRRETGRPAWYVHVAEGYTVNPYPRSHNKNHNFFYATIRN